MTKEEVLQKVNDYCNEKSYTSETLTDEFKDKFADFFAKKYSEETAIDAEGVEDDLKFNINTAFSATSKGLTAKQQAFSTEKTQLENQIAEVKKQIKTPTPPKPTQQDLPQEVKDKLDRLEKFEVETRKQEKFEEIMTLAKKGVRQDLHPSLVNYAKDYVVTLEESAEEQAKKLTARFQEIFKDSIGDIKPLAPQVTKKRDEEAIEAIPKIKVTN